MDENKFWLWLWLGLFLCLDIGGIVIGATQYLRDKMFVQAGYIQTVSTYTSTTGFHWEKK